MVGFQPLGGSFKLPFRELVSRLPSLEAGGRWIQNGGLKISRSGRAMSSKLGAPGCR